MYSIMVTAISVMGGDEKGNIALRVGIEPTLLAFQVSMLTIKPFRLPAIITTNDFKIVIFYPGACHY